MRDPTLRAALATLLGIGALALGVAGCSSDDPAGDGHRHASHAKHRAGAPQDRPKPPWKRPERKSRPRPLRGDARHARAPSIPAGAKRTMVSGIVDGDTVDLAGLGSSRLIGIDTPEVYGGAECFGARASAFTKRELPTGTAVFYEHGTERTDRYGRDLVYVWLPGGTFFNALLAKQGYAITLTIPPNDDYAELFRRLAAASRQAGRGLWSPSTCGGNPDKPAGGAGGAAGGGSASASAGDRDCADFRTRSQAQRYFKAKGGPGRDPDYLDGDGDGVACETLP